MNFQKLAVHLSRIEATASRNKIGELLAELVRESSNNEVDKVVYLSLGRIGPLYQTTEFYLAEKMAVRAVARAFGVEPEEVNRRLRVSGDLGEAAQQLASTKNEQYLVSPKNTHKGPFLGGTPPRATLSDSLRISPSRALVLLTVSDVFERLMAIAWESGTGSQERKLEKTAALLRSLDSLSCRYAVRIILGKLRLGFSDKTVLDGLSLIAAGDKSERKRLEEAYNVRPDVGWLAKKVLQLTRKPGTDFSSNARPMVEIQAASGSGRAQARATGSGVLGSRRLKSPVALSQKNGTSLFLRVFPRLGIPVMPMLAQRLKDPEEMIKKMCRPGSKVAVEPKLDGLRIQIHFKRGKKGLIKAFTRNLNETGWMFPELEKLGKYLRVNEAILDTEAVGVDEKMKAMASFQSTMTRRRKHQVETTASLVPIQFFVFDLLFADGRNMLNKPYEARRKLLIKAVKPGELIRVVDCQLTNSAKEIERLNVQKQKEGLEGIMAKKVKSEYVPGRTGHRWVKMKERAGNLAKMADTIDAVVMGYMAGRGKRAQFGLGKILVGIKDGEKVRTLSKVGTGMTEERLVEMKTRLDKLRADEKPGEYEVDKNLTPDVWVTPRQIVEIAADSISKSPNHSLGISLRFPKFVRFRDDKGTDQATTIKEVKKLYELQK